MKPKLHIKSREGSQREIDTDELPISESRPEFNILFVLFSPIFFLLSGHSQTGHLNGR